MQNPKLFLLLRTELWEWTLVFVIVSVSNSRMLCCVILGCYPPSSLPEIWQENNNWQENNDRRREPISNANDSVRTKHIEILPWESRQEFELNKRVYIIFCWHLLLSRLAQLASFGQQCFSTSMRNNATGNLLLSFSLFIGRPKFRRQQDKTKREAEAEILRRFQRKCVAPTSDTFLLFTPRNSFREPSQLHESWTKLGRDSF